MAGSIDVLKQIQATDQILAVVDWAFFQKWNLGPGQQALQAKTQLFTLKMLPPLYPHTVPLS